MSKISMGLGQLGNSNIIFSSKRRWTFEAEFPTITLPQEFIKLDSSIRFSMLINVANITFFSPSIQTITSLVELSRYLNEEETNVSSIISMGKGKLCLWSGAGDLWEEWTLDGVRVKKIEFGDSDYACQETTMNVGICWSKSTYQDFYHKWASPSPSS